MAPTTAKRSRAQNPLREIVSYFLKLGLLGFGGPFAVMAAIQKELVDERKWLPKAQFNQSLALIKALPGPTATQLAIRMGQLRAGTMGGFLAGFCLLFPAFLMMLGIGYAYQTFLTKPSSLVEIKAALFGMQAAALGVIGESLWRLTTPYRKLLPFWIVVFAAAVLTHLRPSLEPLIILGFGLIGIFSLKCPKGRPYLFAISPLFLLTLVCLKAGAFVFGTGLAIVPMLEHDVVTKYQWLTHSQFMDALAFGQITPGPVIITATFIGYQVAGVLGATLATFAIFAPAFFNILTWFPYVEKKFAATQYAARFVQYAIGAVVGAIAVTLYRLAKTPAGMDSTSGAGSDTLFWITSALAFALMLRTKIPVWALIPAAGLVSFCVKVFSIPLL